MAGLPKIAGLRRELWQRVGLWLWLGLVSLASSFAVTPGLSSQQLPSLGSDDLGKPFQAASAAGLKATRDYDIPHEKLTERRRREARVAVRPVYDYRFAVRGEVLGAVRESFSSARERLAGEDERHRDAPTRRRRPDERIQTDVRGLFEARLGPVEKDDFAALVQTRFSPVAEAAVVALLEKAYAAPIARSRDELNEAAPGGLTLRSLDGTWPTERRLASAAPPLVFDVAEAGDELDRFASVPGNLLADAPPTLVRAVLRVAKLRVRPNLTVNIAETEARRDAAEAAVAPAVISLKKGEKVIGDGELVNENHLVLLAGMRAQTHRLDRLQLQLGGLGLVVIVVAGAYAFLRSALRRFRPTRKDALLLGTLLPGALFALHAWMAVGDAVHDRYPRIPLDALYVAMPVAAGTMLARFILGDQLALFFALAFAPLAGMAAGNSLSFSLFTLVGSLVAAGRIARAKDRAGIFRAGAFTGAVQLLTVGCLAFAEGKPLTWDLALSGLGAFVGGALLLPMTVMALTPLVELVFGYASDIKLLELANLNHPALKELIVQAPGTYHHSIILGSLVEAAAEAIGANPLLARSCAYYHDIGKGRNPLFFGENQRGDNRHDALAPAMSALIIKRHVTDGLEMAKQYKLPRPVVEAIAQHHGTRLVGFFHHKACREIEAKEGAPPVDETLYRYPGPKPQFRESALVMIGDAVEAAARAMPEPTTAKLQALVQRMVNVVFSEGQLDECDLTLRDLHLIAQSFVKTLEGIYHTRPQYPPGAVGGKPALVANNGKRTGS